MSVNVYDKSKVGTADELTPVATMGRNRVWTGTKAAAEAAMRNGDIGNGTVVYITDDYDDKTVIDTANYAVTAGVANEAKEANHAAKATTADTAGVADTAKTLVGGLDRGNLIKMAYEFKRGTPTNAVWENVLAPVENGVYLMLATDLYDSWGYGSLYLLLAYGKSRLLRTITVIQGGEVKLVEESSSLSVVTGGVNNLKLYKIGY